jgi:hypothetical protein
VKRAALLALPALLLVGAAYATVLVTRPDPLQHAVADGCKRDRQAIFAGLAPNWVYVEDRNFPADGLSPPPQWVSGVVDAANQPYLAAHPAGGDDPLTHLSYDFNVNVLPDLAYSALAGGDVDARTGNFEGEGEETGRLHTERETGSLPRFAWPEKGDRVMELGSWVWDCDHFSTGERTEFHPYRALWVQRRPQGRLSAPSPSSPRGEAEGDLFVSTDATPAGIEAECAHRTKGDGFKQCLRTQPAWLSVNGRYELTLPAPARPSARARLRVRVVDRGSTPNAPAPKVAVGPAGVTVSFVVAGATLERVVVAKQVFVGWTPMPARALPDHLRVTLTKLLVRRAMDPSCPADKPLCPNRVQTTRAGQIADAPGEWNLYWDVDGIWGLWSPLTVRARDGQSFTGRQTVDLYVPRGRPWRIFALARECDFGVLGSFGGQNVTVQPCPKSKEIGHSAGDDYPGALEARFASPARSLGAHTTNSIVAGSTCPPENRKGCYALSYAVRRIDDAKARAR